MAELIGLVASVLQLLDTFATAITLIKDLHNAPKEQLQLLSEIQSLQPLLVALQSRIQANSSTAATSNLQDLLYELGEMMNNCSKKLQAEGRLARVSKPIAWTLWNKKEVQVDLDKIERFKTLLNSWLTVDIWDINQQQSKIHKYILMSVNSVKDAALEQQKKNTYAEWGKIIEWISPINSFQRQADIFHTLHPGTGQWLLKDKMFKSWQDSSGQTLWCRGILNGLIAGAGKTVLTCVFYASRHELLTNKKYRSLVIHHLESQEKKIGVAWAYLNHKETETQTPVNILASLLKQLTFGLNIVPAAIQELYQYHHNRQTRPHADELLKIFPSVIANKQIFQSPRLSKHVQAQSKLGNEIRTQIVQSAKGIQQEDERELAQRALMWVVNAKRLLSVGELREALAIEPMGTTLDVDNLLDIHTILSVCAGLVIVDDTTAVVRLVHYTTQHYLDEIQTDRFSHAQTEITSRSLNYLSFVEFINLPKDEDDTNKLLREHPFLEYSHYCLVHAAGEPEIALQDQIIEFLRQGSRWCRFWFKIVSVQPWFVQWAEYPSALSISAAFNLQATATFLLTEEPFASNKVLKSYALYIASHFGHLQMLQILIENGASMNATGGKRGTALHAAVYQRNDSAVQLLIDKGADVNAQGEQYGTALNAAIRYGSDSTVQLLLEKSTDLNVSGGRFGTALSAAIFCRNNSLIQILLKKGADVNVKGGYYGTALQTAARWDNTVVQLLIEHGANVNAQGGIYGTALCAAAYNERSSVVQLLVNNGANVNTCGGKYGTALQAATCRGAEFIIKFLIEKGADVNVQGGEDCTVLNVATSRGPELKAVVHQLIIANGADMSKKLASQWDTFV
ncbi:ankyrin repeat-containing domain protein [Mycena capillaripes]|nr:ankyrin repeat-containing domain protein [Mycena capillaripes]